MLSRPNTNLRLLAILIAFSVASLATAQEMPSNLGRGLKDLVLLQRSNPTASLRGKSLAVDLRTGARRLVTNPAHAMVVDRANRVLVNVYLKRSSALEDVRQRIASLSGSVVAEDAAYRQGSLATYLSVQAAEEIARMEGVATVKLVHKGHANAGAVTSEGAALLHADQVNASGITGQGITIGIISDSFNNVPESPTSAYDDVKSGDLPNIGVSDGRPGLKFLSDGAGDALGDLDEGRAIAQIAYDLAPGISMCFISGELGETSFAANVRRLRTDSSCFADIIVDDIGDAFEPWFSDGQAAQAVNDVVTSTTLAGKQVAYFSAAGNDNGSGYASPLRIVANAAARALTGQGVDLSTIPASIDTGGGFHNFNPNNGATNIAQKLTFTGLDPTAGLGLVVQWDDLFDATPNGITTALNLLIFDSTGKFLSELDTTDPFAADEPLLANIALSDDGTYYFVIARSSKGTHLASQVRYRLFPSGATVTGDYINLSQPTIGGHESASNSITVGAYFYDNGTVANQYTPELEPYSSAGPILSSFDSSGNRLSTPMVRQKPDISAPDCVSTTFFINPDDDDAFYQFCGTSAAAPHAAAVAALLLQSAGGPGSLTASQIRTKLQESTAARNLTPFSSQATLTSGSSTVTITATGDYLDGSEDSANLFNVTFTSATAGQTLMSLTIDATPAGVNFNPSTRTGYPLTIGAVSSGVTVTSTAPTSKTKTLTLAFSGFTSGSFLNFGIEPDLTVFNSIADSATMLAGSNVTAVLSGGITITGKLANVSGTGYNSADGFGLINAAAALKAP